ncbi:MAG TPA: serine hydrolase domain-containing protein [Gemmatimonadaceae bacterium]|nr:serine hydrolase domain-containing protein [Gemmatimonadaceae bacterium]
MKSQTLILAGAGLLMGTARGATAQADRARVVTAVDSIAQAALGGGHAAGLSIAVVRGGDTLVLRGYGKASLELSVPTPDRAVYEIGSVTKQFTSAAILQLADEHKLSLDDDLTKYFPTYPMHGHRVTIRRLMDHTSGIHGYTEMPAFGRLMARSLPKDSLVAMFSGQPFDFAPGDAMSYSNSAYFLLGLIIEKVSGQTYAHYLAQHEFQPAGMRDTRYCSNSDVIQNRVSGYDVVGDTIRPAQYIDMIWPYSAGALCSTVGDLVAWVRALHTGRMLSPSAYHEMITPAALNDGAVIRYAKGLAIDSLDGHRRISHGGGIPGFLSTVQYFPDDSLIVVVLVNSAGPVSPESIARSIVDLALGARPPSAAVFKGQLADYAGAYSGMARGGRRTVSVVLDSAGHALVYRPANGESHPLEYLGGDTFGFDEARLKFVRTASHVRSLVVDEVYGYNFYGKSVK